MNVSPLRGRLRRPSVFPRARISAGTMVLLIVLRGYAIAAIGIAIYAFFRALH